MNYKIISFILLSSALTFTGCSHDQKQTPEVSAPPQSSSTVPDAATDSATNAADSKADSDTTADTLGARLFHLFEQELADTSELEPIARTIADASGMDCDVFPISEGFLNGFTKNITGFTTGYGIAPFIGSIPFICYLFKTEQPDQLKKDLEALSDPRWNICTEADETIIRSNDSFVFFAMCPNDESLQ